MMFLLLSKSFHLFGLSVGMLLFSSCLSLGGFTPLAAQENPYIVVYDHNLE